MDDPTSQIAQMQGDLAVHEAAHCLVAAYCGYSIDRVSIGCDPVMTLRMPSVGEQAYFASLSSAENGRNYLAIIVAGDVGVGVARTTS
jgi:hypothetical protein